MSKPKKRRRSPAEPRALPKGAYRLPTGGYITQSKGTNAGSDRNRTLFGGFEPLKGLRRKCFLRRRRT